MGGVYHPQMVGSWHWVYHIVDDNDLAYISMQFHSQGILYVISLLYCVVPQEVVGSDMAGWRSVEGVGPSPPAKPMD